MIFLLYKTYYLGLAGSAGGSGFYWQLSDFGNPQEKPKNFLSKSSFISDKL